MRHADYYTGAALKKRYCGDVMEDKAGMVLEYKLVGADFDAAGEASSNIKKVLQQLGVSPDASRRAAISAYEAEMNVIIHAYSGLMRAEFYFDRVIISVSDQGPGIKDIELAMSEGYSTAPDHIREMGFGAGMGLPNIVRCTDDLDIKSTVGIGTTIIMTICYN